MLSYENNPPDPLNSVGKSTVQHNSGDENITGDKDLPGVEHQLIASSVDAQSFSIRDFVLAARSKDIGTNWPFPDKHLKLCLKHGVKDLLPPFQSKPSKRKQCSGVSLEETRLVADQIITSIPDEEPSARVDSLTVCTLSDVALKEKITVDPLDVSFEKSDKDSEFPSSVTSNSQSYSYPSRSGGIFKHHKFGKSAAKLSAKKCKLVVKFPSVHSSNEEIMPHKTNLSESPASKVCPVCKTFSSSSNTTLNAHIDQCLSMDEASEGITDSKIAVKCKVKPRKMRSMVDIYATALECTIEDLDRRNGSNWATDLSTPPRNNCLSSAQGNKKQITSPTEPDKEDNDDDGVYIDASGRKLRILSKMDMFSSVAANKEDHGSQMSKILLSSKKKNHGVKHHKRLRLAVSNKNLLAPKANSAQVPRSQKPSSDALLISKGKARYQINGFSETDEPVLLRAKGFHQRPGHYVRSVQRSTIQNQKARVGSVGVEDSSSEDLSRELTCFSESHKKVKSTDDIHISAKRLAGVKRTGLSLSKDKKNYNMNTNDHKRQKKSTGCVNERAHEGKNSTWKPLKQLNISEKEIDRNRLRTVKSADGTIHRDRFLQKPDILHRSNTSSLSQLSAHEPQIWKKTLCLTNEEDHVQIEDEEEDEYEDTDSDEEDVAKWHSESHGIHETLPEHTENCCAPIGSRIDESEENTRTLSRLSKEGALNVSASRCDEFVDNLSVPLSSGKALVRERSDIQTDPCMNLTAERSIRSFIRSMNPGIQVRADSFDYQSASPQQSKDSSNGPISTPCPPDPALDNEIRNYTIMELESDIAHGNRCSDIDPIPIPGPPGSFLPSPGNAETEDYHGNSSLTASVISSHEQGDGSSLDSPNSAASSVSNLANEMSEKAGEKLPTSRLPDSSVLVFPNPSSEFSVDKAPEIPQEKIFEASQSEYGKHKNFLKPQIDNQPCCCSRKERVSRGSMDDYQESQLLRRRTMPAVVLPIKENISCSLNSAPSYAGAAGPNIYSLSRSSSFQVEAIPVLGTPVDFSSPKYSDTLNSSKFHTNMDSESASPSAVLRLMGKNLMVAKNDEDLPVTVGDAARSDANTRMLSREAASPTKLPSNSYYPQYQRAFPPEPVMNSSASCSNMRRSLDFRMPNEPWGQINFPRNDFANHSQAMLTQSHDMHINKGVPAPLDRKWPMQQCTPNNGFDMLADQMHRSTPAAIDFRKQVITIDDDAENEVGALKNDAKIMKVSCALSAGAQDQSRLIYPVYPGFSGFSPALSSTPIYMQQGPSNTCFPIPFSGHYVNPPQMNYPQNGSYVLQGGGPFMASSSPSTHLKPGMFYSPRLP